MEPKWAPGVPKWIPKLSQNTRKHIQSHSKVPLGLQNVPQGVFEVKAAPSGFELQAKSLPRPGARRRRRRSGRGLEGRAHQAVRRKPRAERTRTMYVTRGQISLLIINYRGCRLWPRPQEMKSRGDPERRRKQVTKTKTSNGRPKREKKRPKPQSDRAGAIQTLFATLHTKSKYH